MTRVFVDSSALLTLLDADDPRQADVKAAFAEHQEDDLLTHGYVVAESLAVARRRFGVEGAITLLDDILPAIGLLPVDAELQDESLRRYRASLPSGTSFVDRVSLVVMEREDIDVVLATDPDLTPPSRARRVPEPPGAPASAVLERRQRPHPAPSRRLSGHRPVSSSSMRAWSFRRAWRSMVSAIPLLVLH